MYSVGNILFHGAYYRFRHRFLMTPVCGIFILIRMIGTEDTVLWRPYEEVRKHPPDFRVKYKFYSETENGRKMPPSQGYRSDFSYDDDDMEKIDLFAIHPEFEDENGNVILVRDSPVPLEGTARMWILFPEMRKLVHSARIKPGIIGYFMEGPRKVAIAEVIEIVGLHTNPLS